MATPSTSSSSLTRINTLPPASSGRVTSQVGVRQRPGTPASSLGGLSGILNVALGNPPKCWINTIKNVYSTSASELERLKNRLQRTEADLQNLSFEKNSNTTKLAQLNKELVKITNEIQTKNSTHSKLQADLIKLQKDSQPNSSLMLEDITKYVEAQSSYLKQLKDIDSQQKTCISEKTSLIEDGRQVRIKIEELKKEGTAINNKIADLNSEISSLNRRQKNLKFEVELFLPIANCGEAEKIDILLNFRSPISGITKDKNDEKEEENTRSASNFSLSSSTTSSTRTNRIISPSSSLTSKPLLWQELPTSWTSDQLKSNEAEMTTNKQQVLANETELSNIKKGEFTQIIGKMMDLRSQLDYFNQCIDFEALCLQNLETHIDNLAPFLNSSKAMVEKELNEKNARKKIHNKNLAGFRTEKENLENGKYRDLTNRRNTLQSRISTLAEQNLKINNTIEALSFHAKFCQSIQDKMIGHSGIDVALEMNVESILEVTSIRQTSKEQGEKVQDKKGEKRKEGPSTPAPASQTLNNVNTGPSENNVSSTATKRRKKVIEISSDEDDDNDNKSSSSTTSQPIASLNQLKGRLKKISSSSEEDSSDSSSSSDSDDDTPIIRRSKKISNSSDVDSSDSSSSSDSDDEKTPVNSSSTTPKITRSPAKKVAASSSSTSRSSTSNSFEILRLQNRKRRIKVKCPKDAPEDLKLIVIYNYCIRKNIKYWTGFYSDAMKVEKDYRISPLKKKEKKAGPYIFQGKPYPILERPKDPESAMTTLLIITSKYNAIVKDEPNLSFEELLEKIYQTCKNSKKFLKKRLNKIFELASQNENVIKTSKESKTVLPSQAFEAFKQNLRS